MPAGCETSPVTDPYKTLGVARTADQAAIKAAYRKLAKKYHPDLNPGDPDIERRFKEVSAAYDVLGDPDKRARFDRGELDQEGRDRAGPGFWRNSNRRSTAGAGAAGGGPRPQFDRSEERRVWQECGSTCKSRGSPSP